MKIESIVLLSFIYFEYSRESMDRYCMRGFACLRAIEEQLWWIRISQENKTSSKWDGEWTQQVLSLSTAFAVQQQPSISFFLIII